MEADQRKVGENKAAFERKIEGRRAYEAEAP
jgi:hypothetical protein